MSGFFVVIEGIDCAGKSTLAALLAEALEQRGYPTLHTKEPTENGPGKEIRDAAAAGLRLGLEHETELFMRDRLLHIEDEVRPALDEGKIVVCDRYYFSTAVYQGARAMPFGPGVIMAANRAVFPEPDLLIFLDLRPEKVLERIKINRKGERSPFELDINTVRTMFVDVARRYKGSKRVFDTEHALPEIVLSWSIDAVLSEYHAAEESA